MPGAYLSLLDTDFAYALADVGEAITINHVSAQTLTIATGAFVTAEQQQVIEALVERIARKDVLMSAGKYLENDLVFRFRSTGLTIAVEVGDTITYSSSTYKIYSVDKIKNVYRVLGRKAT